MKNRIFVPEKHIFITFISLTGAKVLISTVTEDKKCCVR